MNRKEEIENKAKMRADQYSHPAEWNDCYHHWIQGAEYADKTMIDKACEWLEPVFKNYAGYNCGMDLIKDFRKAMEE